MAAMPVTGDAPEAEDVRLVQARVGTRLDRFTVDGVLFVGATTAIHTALEDGTGESVVLKVLHPRLRDDETMRSRLVRTALVGPKITHPAFVRPRGLGHAPDGAPFVQLEHVVGEPLDEILRRDGPLSVDAALAIAEEALGVIAAAHVAGLVHGPLRTTKLLVTRDESLRVLDCGAHPRRPSVAATQAPELLDAETAPDLGAVAILLFGLLAGVRVLHLAPPPEAVRRIAREAVLDTPGAFGLDAALTDVILRATGHGRPFASARAMRDAVAGIREGIVWQTAFGETRGSELPVSTRRALSIIPTPAPPSGVRAGSVRRLLLVEEDETAAI